MKPGKQLQAANLSQGIDRRFRHKPGLMFDVCEL
jgi:hypothetical protein